MTIKQFTDENLSHFSYALVCNGEMVVIDPSRNPQQYFDYASVQNAVIKAVIETHPHADFVSSHLEISEITGAPIYTSKRTDANYPHETYDDGDILKIGQCRLSAFNTPGHSPDSISVLVYDENNQQKAVFTGDTLFIGDCGRPDLREKNGDMATKREELAEKMFESLQVFKTFDEAVIVYPAHGAGSLCGKGMSDDKTSTISREKAENWSLNASDKASFMEELLQDQPMIPHYFSYNVDLNQKGAGHFQDSIDDVKIIGQHLVKKLPVIDARDESNFKKGHLPFSYNIQGKKKFETWLGAVIKPNEKFYLTASSEKELTDLIERTAKIGYESFIEGAFVFENGSEKLQKVDKSWVENHQDRLTIVDVRSKQESEDQPYFEDAINVPLNELIDRINEIPDHQKILVHCAGGYRSAAAASIIKHFKPNSEVFDLSDNITDFK